MMYRAICVAAGLMLYGCGEQLPRAEQYFAANLDEARQVVEGCQAGRVRGAECDNADRALQRAKARERSKHFLGDGKAYTPR